MNRSKWLLVCMTFLLVIVVSIFAHTPLMGSFAEAGGREDVLAAHYRAEKLARLRGETFVCATTIDGSLEKRYLEEKLRHERNLQRLARLRQRGIMPRKEAALRADVGDIAVIEDDGRLVLPANPFDLNRSTVVFTPVTDQEYEVRFIDDVDFDDDLGTKITAFRGGQAPEDDGFAQVDFQDGFAFTFYGRTYDKIFVGTNGYLTFRRGDFRPEINVTRFLIGPRIAALWQDLDPSRVNRSSTAGIFVKQLPDRLVVTYRNIPTFGTGLFNTFQVTLSDTGEIAIGYLRVRSESGLVGISPGRTSRQNAIDLSDPPAEALGNAILEVFRDIAEVDVLQVPEVFYETHDDRYDFVYIWTDFDFDLGGAFAFYLGARNDAEGIGVPIFDRASSFGSDGRLQGLLVLNNIVRAYPESPTRRFLGLNSALSILGQEQGHRWLAFVELPGDDPTLLLGRQLAHWSFFFNTESTNAFSQFGAPRSSSMEGNVWRDLGDGLFSTPSNELIDGYSQLDQYLMGLRAPEEVQDSFVIVDPDVGDPMRMRRFPPRGDVTVRGRRRTVTIGDIIAANGPRVPDYRHAQRVFRVAFILLIQQGTTPSQATLDKLNAYRTAWEEYFFRATQFLGAIDTRLTG